MHAGEHIVLSLRKHPLILVGQLLPFAVLDYIPYLLPGIAQFLDSSDAGTSIPVQLSSILAFGNPWFDFIVGIYWLFVWMGAFGVFTDYFLDRWVITNHRIIDINQKSFWSREIGTLFLNRVQNVETSVGGIFHTLFNFGTVSVESAGADQHRIEMPGLPNPGSVREIILREVATIQEKGTPPVGAKHGV